MGYVNPSLGVPYRRKLAYGIQMEGQTDADQVAVTSDEQVNVMVKVRMTFFFFSMFGDFVTDYTVSYLKP